MPALSHLYTDTTCSLRIKIPKDHCAAICHELKLMAALCGLKIQITKTRGVLSSQYMITVSGDPDWATDFADDVKDWLG